VALPRRLAIGEAFAAGVSSRCDLDQTAMQPRYWIAVASKEHVRVGVRGGFAQFSHGRLGPAKRLSKGDWVIYYSGKEKYREPELCQKFTAIGQVVDREPVRVEQFPGFKPWRRRIRYRRAMEIDVHPLIGRLSFIKNKSRWGAAFRFGFLEIGEPDFTMISKRMLPNVQISPRRDGGKTKLDEDRRP
jgi:predicted RNA-binding protein